MTNIIYFQYSLWKTDEMIPPKDIFFEIYFELMDFNFKPVIWLLAVKSI